MSGNSIPDELRSEHLFLLVGTNPLPDWVAAKLLLCEGGQLYLVHSGTTHEVANRLARFAMENNCKQPIYVPVANPYQPSSVSESLKERIENLQSESVGLNYTGGTKVMSVHSYCVFSEWQRGKSSKKIVFSYLEASRSTMHFESFPPHYPTGHECKVGLKVEIKLRDLFRLHEEYELTDTVNSVQAKSVAALLTDVHSNVTGQIAWHNEVKLMLRQRPQMLALSPQFAHIAETLIKGGSTGTKSLEDVVAERRWGFTDAGDLAKWLQGHWLEDYLFACLEERHSDYKVHGYERNMNPILGRGNLEVDVVAMRGYQLHVVSCYGGHNNERCKLKLFEAFTRARQLGGDEARAALVCCSDDPRLVESEVGEVWDIKERVKVFGRSDLKNLGDGLKAWFDTGAQ